MQERPAGDPFEALGDPHRRRLLDLIAAAPRSVGALADEMPISRPAVSRHLRLLKEAGLVAEEPQGTRRIYRLRDEGVTTMQTYLGQVWGEAGARFRLLAENTPPGRSRREPAVIEPLRIELELRCPPAHAFATWTERFGQWWPRGHTVTGDPSAVVLEPRLGGRIYERAADGTEIDWGEITGWSPPHRLGYLWHIRRDRPDATDVEITFVDRGDGTTHVEIVHSGWERLAGGSSWRDANRGGWAGLLPSFTAACTTDEGAT